MNRLRALTGLLALLLAIRFGVVPWLEWQTNQHESLDVAQRRLEKSEALRANAAPLLASLKQYQGRFAELEKRVPRAAGSDHIKLRMQQEISNVATEYGVKISLFEWLVEDEPEGALLNRVRARMQLTGTGAGIAVFQSQLEARYPNLLVQQYQHSFANATATPGETPVSTVLIADILYLR